MESPGFFYELYSPINCPSTSQYHKVCCIKNALGYIKSCLMLALTMQITHHYMHIVCWMLLNQVRQVNYIVLWYWVCLFSASTQFWWIFYFYWYCTLSDKGIIQTLHWANLKKLFVSYPIAMSHSRVETFFLQSLCLKKEIWQNNLKR